MGGGETAFSYVPGVRWTLIALVAGALLGGCGDGGGSGAPSRDQARAEQLTRFLSESGLDEQLSVTAVRVDGGAVTVETGLAPTRSNEADLIAPCMTLVGLEPWIDSVAVEADDGARHVHWDKDKSGCDTQGLR